MHKSFLLLILNKLEFPTSAQNTVDKVIDRKIKRERWSLIETDLLAYWEKSASAGIDIPSHTYSG